MWRARLSDVWSALSARIPGDAASDGESDDDQPSGSDRLVIEPSTDEDLESRQRTGERSAGTARRAVTDGGSPPEWAGEDPISFDAEDDLDGESLLDAVTSETDDAVVPAETEAEGVESDDAPEATDAAHDGSDGGDADGDGADAEEPESAGHGLRDRLDAVESEHEAVASTVDGIESDMEGLHDEVRSLRSDMETLVDLVKQTAPTRGGAASAAADATESDPGPEAGESDDEDERELADPRTETVGDRLRAYQSGFDSESGAASAVGSAEPAAGDASGASAPEQQDEAASAEASGVASVGPADGSAANGNDTVERDEPVADAEPDEPAADAERDASEDPFEFRKVLLPADEDGQPVVVGDDGQPYLQELPDGYAAEAAVIEWLDHLVSGADKETAARALAYYESIGWMAPSVQSELLGYLAGVGDVDDVPEPDGPPEGLELAHHRQSLDYVTALASGEVSVDGV